MTNTEIWNRVEDLRARFESLKTETIPLDLISFVELDLRLDLIPYDRLKDDFGADAAILADFSGFYIDGEIFDRIDLVRGAQLNRLRFSIAHELGHLFLHREVFEAARISSSEHLLDWLNEHDGRKYELEREANEFAGRLLVPVEILKDCFEKMLPLMDQKYGRHVWVANAELRSKTAEMIAPRFGVHPIAIETRFDREDRHPVPEAVLPYLPAGVEERRLERLSAFVLRPEAEREHQGEGVPLGEPHALPHPVTGATQDSFAAGSAFRGPACGL